jgi:hypothetical protein
MTKHDKKWNRQYEQLVEFKRKKGHCLVPRKYEQDKSIGPWVMTQRTRHANNTMLPARKELLDELDFAWRVEALTPPNQTTSSGTSSMKSCSNTNERLAIVRCQKSTSKISLLGGGL